MEEQDITKVQFKKQNKTVTRTRMGAGNCNFPALLGNYGRATDRPTNQPSDQPINQPKTM